MLIAFDAVELSAVFDNNVLSTFFAIVTVLLIPELMSLNIVIVLEAIADEVAFNAFVIDLDISADATITGSNIFAAALCMVPVSLELAVNVR